MIIEVPSETTPISNPKRGKESRSGRAGWYTYYAGFSPTFVQDALKTLGPPSNARVLDPWNGSGTTTDVTASSGFTALGFDLNPVMVIVAKARLLDSSVKASLKSILEDILSKAALDSTSNPREPLRIWFTRPTASAIRSIEKAIQTLLIEQEHHGLLFEAPSLEFVSSLAAFFYVATFRALRELLKPFRSTNPTWLKEPSNASERIALPVHRLHTLLRNEVEAMAVGFESQTEEAIRRTATIDRAASGSLPIASGSIDAVISSPPYCTRIDYVKKTSPELALLGAHQTGLLELRDQMIGTPTISKTTPRQDTAWGETCLNLMETISNHDSYASKSYYSKTYVQYFAGIHASLREIDRTLRPGGSCVLVVQDSNFKNVHIDLATILDEMAHNQRWMRIFRADFPTNRTIAGIRAKQRVSSTAKFTTETVLGFRKDI